jgi:predicted GNAT family acetyltransferase
VDGMSDVVTSHNPQQSRYEAHIDGELAGFAEYQLTDRLVVFTHTEVDDRFEGRGVGSAVVRYALDDVRTTDRQVLPLCPFVKGWIGKHPDYQDLLYGQPASTAKD